MNYHNHPFIAGLIAGATGKLKCGHQYMRVTIPQLAKKYDVTPRTIARWKKAGVKVTEPLAVAAHLSASKTPKLSTLAACAAELDKLSQ